MTVTTAFAAVEGTAAACCLAAGLGLARDNVGGALLFGLAGLAMAVGGVAVAVRGAW